MLSKDVCKVSRVLVSIWGSYGHIRSVCLIHHMQKNNEKTNVGSIAGLNEYIDLGHME